MSPLCVDLFCGLGGWAEGFLSEGWRVIGFDVAMQPQYPGLLAVQDVATLAGWQFRRAHMIVASPPCQAYSYRAMPWKRAKSLPAPSNELFDAPFRIRLEASAAAGRHIPLIVENVRGAQPWVGRAAWHHGSYYLWGDVPALMPNLRGPGAAIKKPGQVHWREGYPHTRHMTNPREHVKQPGLSGKMWFDRGAAQFNSNSRERKAATAEIAKIPLGLAEHIARVFHPCA